MKRRREFHAIIIRLSVILCFLFSVSYSARASFDEFKNVQIGDLDYAISVPVEWERSYLEEEMKVHMRVLPLQEVQGRFTVFVRDRTNVELEDWAAYHRDNNLPNQYGSYTIDFEKEVTAGSNRAWMFHLLDLSGRMGYGLYETLVCTEDHVVFISYLYDLYQRQTAWDDLEKILASFTSDPDAVKRAGLSYDEGRTLGLASFGLFLRLPEGWFPQKAAAPCDYVLIQLPSGGSMEVAVSRRLPRGEEGLQSFLKRKIKPLKISEEKTPYAFGAGQTDALCQVDGGSEKQPPLTLVYGLHGDGGYGLALRSRDKTETELFHKVAARALLIEPACAKQMWNDAMAKFEKGIKTDDVAAVREALSVLELFSGCNKTVKKLDAGFKSCERIQVACAIALGRLASSNAGRLLERCLKDDHITEPARKACIRAMAVIGTPREKKCLENLQKKTPRYFSEDLKKVLEQSLQDLQQAR